jgi:hypothetical protein
MHLYGPQPSRRLTRGCSPRRKLLPRDSRDAAIATEIEGFGGRESSLHPLAHLCPLKWKISCAIFAGLGSTTPSSLLLTLFSARIIYLNISSPCKLFVISLAVTYHIRVYIYIYIYIYICIYVFIFVKHRSITTTIFV